MNLKYGLNKNVSNSEYHADKKYLSSSGLKCLLKDEVEFRDKYIYGNYTNEENSAFSFGTYIHTMLLEPHLLESTTAVFKVPDHLLKKDKFGNLVPAKRMGKLWDDFKLDNKDRTIITASEFETAQKMLENYSKLPQSQYLLTNGRSEETFAGEILGVPVKVRFDSIGNGYGLDVKTSSFPCDINSLQQTIDKYDYALSAALYVEVARMYGEVINNFYFLFANKKTCDITLIETSPRFLEQGREQVYKALTKYKELQAKGFFDTEPLLKIVESTEVR